MKLPLYLPHPLLLAWPLVEEQICFGLSGGTGVFLELDPDPVNSMKIYLVDGVDVFAGEVLRPAVPPDRLPAQPAQLGPRQVGGAPRPGYNQYFILYVRKYFHVTYIRWLLGTCCARMKENRSLRRETLRYNQML